MHEFELLKTIYASASQSTTITIGPGDDMGEICVGDRKLLCAVDQLIVGRHVEPSCPAAAIGRKAIARCFSDIAAMAGTPVGCLMTACVPSTTENSWCEEIFHSARTIADEWGGPIFGGDISSSADAQSIFTVTALATPPKSGAVTRRGAELGDYICVTGTFGNSLSGHHLTFTPRILEAQELKNTLGDHLHSMIDVSDGLGQDASHLATNELQLVIDTDAIPLREGATVEGAISDGEDYELLFTTSAKPPAHVATVIGKVEHGNQKVVTIDGRNIATCGWVHK